MSKASEHHHVPTRPRLQNTIMSPHAQGIRTPSCPHTPQASEHRHVPIRPRHLNTIMSPHALKGQKLLAQGNALGNYEHKPVAL